MESWLISAMNYTVQFTQEPSVIRHSDSRATQLFLFSQAFGALEKQNLARQRSNNIASVFFSGSGWNHYSVSYLLCAIIYDQRARVLDGAFQIATFVTQWIIIRLNWNLKWKSIERIVKLFLSLCVFDHKLVNTLIFRFSSRNSRNFISSNWIANEWRNGLNCTMYVANIEVPNFTACHQWTKMACGTVSSGFWTLANVELFIQFKSRTNNFLTFALFGVSKATPNDNKFKNEKSLFWRKNRRRISS